MKNLILMMITLTVSHSSFAQYPDALSMEAEKVGLSLPSCISQSDNGYVRDFAAIGIALYASQKGQLHAEAWVPTLKEAIETTCIEVKSMNTYQIFKRSETKVKDGKIEVLTNAVSLDKNDMEALKMVTHAYLEARNTDSKYEITSYILSKLQIVNQ